MPKKKPTRKELLKEPDEFLTLSARFFAWIQNNRGKLRNVGIGVGILVVLYMAGYFYYQHINKKGQNIYNNGYSILIEAIGPDLDENKLDSAKQLFTRLIDSYPFSKVSRLAFPQKAFICFLQGRYDQAISLYKEFLKKIPNDRDYQILTAIALATCYEQKGDLRAAQKLLAPLCNGPRHPFQEFSIMALARIYRMEDNKEKSDLLLKDFIQKFPQSPFLPLAKAFL